MPRPVVPIVVPPVLLGRAFLFDVVGEDHVGVIADGEILADGDPAGGELVDFLRETAADRRRRRCR